MSAVTVPRPTKKEFWQPTLSEIEVGCQHARSLWSKYDWLHRNIGGAKPWRVPVCPPLLEPEEENEV